MPYSSNHSIISSTRTTIQKGPVLAVLKERQCRCCDAREETESPADQSSGAIASKPFFAST